MASFSTNQAQVPQKWEKAIAAWHSVHPPHNITEASKTPVYRQNQQLVFLNRNIFVHLSKHISPVDALKLARVNRYSWKRIVEQDVGFWRRIYEYRFSGNNHEGEQERGFLDAFMAADVLPEAPILADTSFLPEDIYLAIDTQSIASSTTHSDSEKQDTKQSIITNNSVNNFDSNEVSSLYLPRANQLRRKRVEAKPLGTKASILVEIQNVRDMIARNVIKPDSDAKLLIHPNVDIGHTSQKTQACTATLSEISDTDSYSEDSSSQSFSITAQFAFSSYDDDEADNADQYSIHSNESEATELGYDANLQEEREARRRRPRARSLSAATLVSACSPTRDSMPNLKSPKSSPLSPLSVSNSATKQEPLKSPLTPPMDWLAAGQARAQVETNLRRGTCSRRVVQLPDDAQGPIFVRKSFGRWIAVDIGTRAYLLEVRRKRLGVSRSALLNELINNPELRDDNSFSSENISRQSGSLSLIREHSDTTTVATLVRPFGVEANTEHPASMKDINDSKLPVEINVQDANDSLTATERREAWLKHWTRLSFGEPLLKSRAPPMPSTKSANTTINNSFDCNDATLIEEFEDNRVRYRWHQLALDTGSTDQYGWTGNGVVQVLMNDRYMVRMLYTSNLSQKESGTGHLGKNSASDSMRIVHIWRLNQTSHRTDVTNEFASLLEPCYAVLVPRDAAFEQLHGRWLSIMLPTTIDARPNCRALRVLDLECGVLCPGEMPLNPDDAAHLHAVGEERAFVYQCTLREAPSNKNADTTGKSSRQQATTSKSSSTNNELLLWRLWQFSVIPRAEGNGPQLIGQSVLCITSSADHRLSKRSVNLHSSFIDTSHVLLWSDRGWLAVHHLRFNSFVWESFGEPLANVVMYPSAKRLMLVSSRQARAVVVRLTDGYKAGITSRSRKAAPKKANRLSTTMKLAKSKQPKTNLNTVLPAPSCYSIVADVPSTQRVKPKKTTNTALSGARNSISKPREKVPAPPRHDTASEVSIEEKGSPGTTVYWPESSLATHIIGSLFCRADHGVGASPIWLMDVKTGGGRVGLIRPDKRPAETPETWAPAVDTRVNILSAGPCLIDVYQRNAQLVIWDFMDI
ncbi:hypothetical protein BDF19DRAFT_410940 [Syncephalis fuscata]|nr:hypothetical protein BDF19DRAFT_410940 [Syncephalis fuscata]